MFNKHQIIISNGKSSLRNPILSVVEITWFRGVKTYVEIKIPILANQLEDYDYYDILGKRKSLTEDL